MILVGELVPFALAVIALLLLIGAWLLFQPFKRALSKIPIVGGYVVDVVDTFLGVSIQAVEKDLDLMLVATGRVLWAVGGKVWGWVDHVTHGILVATGLAHDAQRTAAGAGVQATAAQNVASGANAIANQAKTTVDAAVTQSQLNSWVQHFTTENNLLKAGEATAAQKEAADIARLSAAIDTSAASTLAKADVNIATVKSDVISQANALFGEAVTTTTNDIAGVEAQIQGLTGDITGIKDNLAPLLGTLPLIGSIPLLNSLVQSLTTEADTCLKPLCDTVTPNASQLGKLGQFLQGLETLGVDVLVAGLFAEAVTNPAGLAHETVTLVEDVGGPVITGIRDLTGL